MQVLCDMMYSLQVIGCSLPCNQEPAWAHAKLLMAWPRPHVCMDVTQIDVSGSQA